MPPVDEIGAHRVSPAHVAPGIAERIVLIEEVVLALEEDEPVRVVHEVPLGREVEAWPMRVVQRRRQQQRGDKSGGGAETHGGGECYTDASEVRRACAACRSCCWRSPRRRLRQGAIPGAAPPSRADATPSPVTS